MNCIYRVAAVATLLGIAAVAGAQSAATAEPEFPLAAVDYFAAMDDGIRLDAQQVRGRNTWLMWTGGDEAFWDLLASRSFGAFDLLKVLDSRNRATRFSYYGLMNEPGFKQADAADQYGLWLDAPDGTRDPSYSASYDEAFPKDAFLRTYGRASGIVGLRVFPNPDFDAAARRRWDPQRYYDDPAYYGDPKLVRPYRVGMACGFCHVGPHPLHPPADPEHPGWDNLSSNIGDQYLKAGRIFVLPHQEDNFLFQVVNSMPPGTVDTSALATDNINNPRTMNAIYQVGARLQIAAAESLSGGNLDMPGTQKTMPVPHVLKDGADFNRHHRRADARLCQHRRIRRGMAQTFQSSDRRAAGDAVSGRGRAPQLAVFSRDARANARPCRIFRRRRQAAAAGQGARRRAVPAGKRRHGRARATSLRRELRRLPRRLQQNAGAAAGPRTRHPGMGCLGSQRGFQGQDDRIGPTVRFSRR